MGEIGIPRREFLYVLQFWEVRRIMRGYQRRYRDMWSAARWQTYYIMSAQIGGKGMREAGLRKPTDLLPLPWDTNEKPDLPSEEEIAQIQEEMKMIGNPWKK